MPVSPTESSPGHYCQDFTAANLKGDMTSRPMGDNGASPWGLVPGAAGGQQEEAMVSMEEESSRSDHMMFSSRGDGDEQPYPRSPDIRERGSNRQHMFAHMCDHDYAKQGGLEEMGFPALPNYPSGMHQVFPNPPQSPEPPQAATGESTDVHLRVYSEIAMNYVVYGTTGAMKKLLDYIDSLNSISQNPTDEGGMPTVAAMECREGVILSKALSIAHPCVYEEGNQYQTICRLGTGTFGSVDRCLDRQTGTEFACKKVYIRSFRREEVEVLVELKDNSLGARCLPQVFGVLLDDDFVCIMMEYVDNCWHECVKQHKEHGQKVKEETVIDLLQQSLHGLRHLQLHRVSHCDIKPENMGYNSRGEVKLLDFGTVRLSAEEFTHRGMTPNYMPPEACRRQSHFNSDMWSLGCTMIYLIVQTHPWFKLDKSTEDLLKRIRTVPHQIWEYITYAERELSLSPQLGDLLRKMLHPDPDERVTAEMALKHSVFKLTRPVSGNLSSIGAIGEEVPTVVPTQASNSHPTEVVYERQDQVQARAPHPQPPQVSPHQPQHGPVLRKVTPTDLAQHAATREMAPTQYPARFQRGPPGDGEYPGMGAGDCVDNQTPHDSMDVLSNNRDNTYESSSVPESKPVRPCNYTSGYHSDNNGAVSIEVSYKDRVEEFRVTPQQTIGETWPQLKDTAQKLTGRISGAVAIYEGNRKLDMNTFSEVILTPRKFCLRVLRESEHT